MSKTLQRTIRDNWTARLDEEIFKRYWFRTTTKLVDGKHVTTSATGEPMPADVQGFIAGYGRALQHVTLWMGQ